MLAWWFPAPLTPPPPFAGSNRVYLAAGIVCFSISQACILSSVPNRHTQRVVTCAQTACSYTNRPIKLSALRRHSAMHQTDTHKEWSLVHRVRAHILVDRSSCVCPWGRNTDAAVSHTSFAPWTQSCFLRDGKCFKHLLT